MSLPNAESSALLPHLLTLHGIDQVRNGEHRDLRVTTRRVLDAAGGHELLPASLFRPVIFLLTMTGSEDLALEWTTSRLATPGGFDPTRSLLLTLVLHTHRACSGGDQEIMDDWPAHIDEARHHSSELVRTEAHYGAAILADIEGDFERMLTEIRQLLDMRIVGILGLDCGTRPRRIGRASAGSPRCRDRTDRQDHRLVLPIRRSKLHVQRTAPPRASSSKRSARQKQQRRSGRSSGGTSPDSSGRAPDRTRSMARRPARVGTPPRTAGLRSNDDSSGTTGCRTRSRTAAP